MEAYETLVCKVMEYLQSVVGRETVSHECRSSVNLCGRNFTGDEAQL